MIMLKERRKHGDVRSICWSLRVNNAI